MKCFNTCSGCGYIRTSFPIISDREADLIYHIIDSIDERKSMIFMSRTFQNEEDTQKFLGITFQKNKKCISINMRSNSIEIIPIDAETCNLIAIKFVPKGKDMPMWLLNFFLKRLGSYMKKKFE